MKTIPLTQGYVALVDDEDYEQVAAHKWCALVVRNPHHTKVYALRNVTINGKKTVPLGATA